jgi:hypothetical protein
VGLIAGREPRNASSSTHRRFIALDETALAAEPTRIVGRVASIALISCVVSNWFTASQIAAAETTLRAAQAQTRSR